MTALISVKNVCKPFPWVRALHDVHVDLQAGEVLLDGKPVDFQSPAHPQAQSGPEDRYASLRLSLQGVRGEPWVPPLFVAVFKGRTK